MSSPNQRRSKRHHRGLNVLICGLIVLAVALSGLAGWKRYAPGQRSATGDSAEQQFANALAGAGIPESWVSVGGLPQATRQRRCFVCPQCQSSCWTQAGGGCPACPFCSLAMVPQGGVRQGTQMALVGGTAAASITAPIPITADATRPHGARGPCTNCHALVRSGAPSLAQVAGGAAPGTPNTLWQGVAAPAIAADAVKPTLIKELGLEVCPNQGAGVKVAGVMGNSYASNAGLRTGDSIITCNGVQVRDVEQFQQLIGQAPPEADARLKILRNGRTKDLAVMVGEGEMEGFTPIQRL